MSRKKTDARIPKWDDVFHQVPRSPWGKSMCAPCHDGAHKDCLGNPCDCLCGTEVKGARKPPRDTSQQETIERFGTITIK